LQDNGFGRRRQWRDSAGDLGYQEREKVSCRELVGSESDGNNDYQQEGPMTIAR